MIDKLKQYITNPSSVSVVNVMSTILVYSLDNYMQIGAALAFFATTIIAAMNKYSSYKQDKLDRIQKREIEMMRMEIEMRQALGTSLCTAQKVEDLKEVHHTKQL